MCGTVCRRNLLACNMSRTRIHLSFNGKPKATASAHKACVTPTSRRHLRLAVKRVWLRPSAALGKRVNPHFSTAWNGG